MFDQSSRDVADIVTIHRVRNGFELLDPNISKGGMVHDPYVFNTLDALVQFLVENDFDVTEEGS